MSFKNQQLEVINEFRNKVFDMNCNFVAAFLTQTISLDDPTAGQCTVKFEIWDTAGQERYRSLAPMYYRGASAAVIVFDITRKDSFAGAKSWVKELQRRGDNDVIIALTGACMSLHL